MLRNRKSDHGHWSPFPRYFPKKHFALHSYLAGGVARGISCTGACLSAQVVVGRLLVLQNKRASDEAAQLAEIPGPVVFLRRFYDPVGKDSWTSKFRRASSNQLLHQERDIFAAFAKAEEP
jgi:hypothetical protein